MRNPVAGIGRANLRVGSTRQREFIQTVVGAYQEADPGHRTVLSPRILITEFEGLIDRFTVLEQGGRSPGGEADEARSKFRRLRAVFETTHLRRRFRGAKSFPSGGPHPGTGREWGRRPVDGTAAFLRAENGGGRSLTPGRRFFSDLGEKRRCIMTLTLPAYRNAFIRGGSSWFCGPGGWRVP